jgi:hypothetical protein
MSWYRLDDRYFPSCRNKAYAFSAALRDDPEYSSSVTAVLHNSREDDYYIIYTVRHIIYTDPNKKSERIFSGDIHIKKENWIKSMFHRWQSWAKRKKAANLIRSFYFDYVVPYAYNPHIKGKGFLKLLDSHLLK